MKVNCKGNIFVNLIWILFLPTIAGAQAVLNPVDFPLRLSGNFGEPRQNHFHSGIDIKTFGREGYAVCAVSDGYVSRVKISAGGFGIAIYLDHDGKYTSVYAHLHHLEGPVADFIDSIRLAGKMNEIEFYPDSGMFWVRAGDLIGISGNTGSSEGPHLHFEWRTKKSQMPLNPLFTSLSELFADTVHPVIRSVKLYVLKNNRWVPDKGGQTISIEPEFPDTIPVDHDTLGIALSCFDPDSNNRNGVHSLLLKSNADTLWYFQLDSFSFDNTRFVNAHIDYNHWATGKEQYRRMFRLAGDKINPGLGAGKIILNESGAVRQLTAVVSDFAGNKDSISFYLKRSEKMDASGLRISQNPAGWDTLSGKVKVILPAGSLYQDTKLEVSVSDSLVRSMHTPVIRIASDDQCPLHHQGTIIWHDTLLWVQYSTRLFLSRFDERFRLLETLPVKRVENSISVSFRNWGSYFFTVDSISPLITGTGVYLDSVDMKLYRFFEFEEKESGLKEYTIEVNGLWQLCKYEIRKQRICLPVDPSLTGPLFYRLEIIDAAGNTGISLFLI